LDGTSRKKISLLLLRAEIKLKQKILQQLSVISGASTVPGLSSAVVAHYRTEFASDETWKTEGRVEEPAVAVLSVSFTKLHGV
jgi:hypothetical protein